MRRFGMGAASFLAFTLAIGVGLEGGTDLTFDDGG
jgi:hypothetical protein